MKTKLWTGGVVLALIITAVVVKLMFFPTVKDAWFTLNQKNLRRVPSGLLIVRPTHFFVNSVRKGFIFATSQSHGHDFQRIMGRNEPLRILFAVAYNQNRARVLLPPDAPKGNFDFLVTVPVHPKQHLRTAIRRRLGYVAQMKIRKTDVLAINRVNASPPGLNISSANEKRHVKFKQGRIWFTHMRLTALDDDFERLLDCPVVDEAGLTNFYDYSVSMEELARLRVPNTVARRDAIQQILNGWGLALKPDTASLKMLVVEKAK